jgi:hypothetical protein
MSNKSNKLIRDVQDKADNIIDNQIISYSPKNEPDKISIIKNQDI